MGLAAGVYLSEAQNPILSPFTHCIVYMCIQNIYSLTEGGRVVESERGSRGKIPT
jgi:hypothetical protein